MVLRHRPRAIGGEALELDSAVFSVAEVLDKVEAVTAIAAREKGLSFTVAGLDRIPRLVVGDPLRTQQVLVNLAGNAVKFTHRGGVRIEVEVKETNPDSSVLAFHVHDTGVGLTPQQIAKLFRSFSQADVSTTRTYGDTGLGLVISRRLAEAMGGGITVESVPGQGSVFTFTMRARSAPAAATGPTHPPTSPPPAGPLVSPASAGVAAPAGRPSAAEGNPSQPSAPRSGRLGGRRLLVAEDNAVNQEIVRELLELEGATVVLVGNGAEALEALEQSPDFDVVLMDVQMPVMDGFEAVRRIRRRPGLDGLAIIAMTANVTVEDRNRCTEAGMNDFVGKPILPDRLFEVLARWLDRSPRAAR